MSFDGEMLIDDKRYEEIIRIGYESAKKNLATYESTYSCTFLNMDPKVRTELSPEEYDEWRICHMAIKVLKNKIN
jgi:hypothetical protein